MTVMLPEAAAAEGAGWQLLDYVTSSPLSAKATAAGVATINFPAVDSDRMWQITRAVIACTGNQLPTLRLYVVAGGADPSQAALRSGSTSGLFDEADYPGDGLWVQTGEQLVAQWVGAAVGAVATCSLQYRLMGR